MATYSFEGKTYNFPDDVTQEEALAFIDSQHTPQQEGAAQAAPTNDSDSMFTPEFNQADTMGKLKLLAGGVGTGLAETGRAIAQLPNDIINTAGAISGALGDENARTDVDIYSGLGGNVSKALAPQTPEGKMIGEALPWLVGEGEVKAGAKLLPSIVKGVAKNTPNLAASTAINMQQEGEEFTPTNYLENAATNALFDIGGRAALGSIQKAREVLPSWLGGTSNAEKVASTVGDNVEHFYQGGDESLQNMTRAAATDEAGNLITPSSTLFDGAGGQGFQQAERRGLDAGDAYYANRSEAAAKGDSLSRAIDDVAGGDTTSAQSSLKDVTDAFKQQKNKLYNESLSGAQSRLDDLKVNNFEMKMSNTKDHADQILKEDADLGAMPTSAKNLLTRLKNQKFTSLKDVDFYKRKLSNEANKAFVGGDAELGRSLNDVKGQLKSEIDLTLRKIDPEVNALYKKADGYFSEYVDDFGKKSAAGKAAANESEARATNSLLGNSDSARENTQKIADSLRNAIDNGDFEGAKNLADSFADALGNTSRRNVFDYATMRGRTAEARNTGKGVDQFHSSFRGELANDLPQMESVEGLGSGSQAAYQQGLIDASKMLQGAEVQQSSLLPRLLNTIGNKAAGVPLGDMLANPLGRVGDALSASKARETLIRNALATATPEELQQMSNINQAIQSGSYQSSPLLSMFGQVGGNAINRATSQPEQSAPVYQGAASDQPLLNMFSGQQVAQPQSQAPQAASNQPLLNMFQPMQQPEPEQHAQTAHRSTFNPEHIEGVSDNVIMLRDALQTQETGKGNEWIRTGAPDKNAGGKPSTAYGPYQLTRDTANDFAKRYPDTFTEEERDYLHRFDEQGKRMLKAKPSDPVYGYGKEGVLTSPRDKELYVSVYSKILQKMTEEKGGSLTKTIQRHRGVDDPSFTRKVKAEYKRKKLAWSTQLQL
ncbi:hypothetical protein MLN87_07375 [Escherichia coli]|nr:hypothetical protein [Escherichia coli]MCN8204084.1 hypothetical protein [Escherichia coli]HAI3384506.1 hypothetical protein [Escherichia coli]HAL0004644.1 hypothetical protein [Escherichia coli]HAP1523986.1 hypothetical protein [Escherichia coli]